MFAQQGDLMPGGCRLFAKNDIIVHHQTYPPYANDCPAFHNTRIFPGYDVFKS